MGRPSTRAAIARKLSRGPAYHPGHGHCHGQAQDEIAAGQDQSALRQVSDRCRGISHRQRQGQCSHRDERDNEAGDLKPEQLHQPKVQLWRQDNYGQQDQDQDSED
jgi:hypothetical protein